MAVVLLSLMVLGVVGCGLSQNPVTAPVENGCASKAGFTPGSEQCCSNYVFAVQMRICCTDPNDNVCYCDSVTYGTMCAANPAPPTEPPVTVTTLCPGPMGRLLNAHRVDNACSARGVVGLATGGQTFCNGAFISHPHTGEKVLYTLSSCWNSVQQAQAASVPTTGVIFEDVFPLDTCTVQNTSATPNPEVTMLTLSKLTGFFVEQHLRDCPSPGCLYTPSSMRDHVDLNNCTIVSNGYTGGAFSELMYVSIQVADITQCGPGLIGTQCFTSPEKGAQCLGDGGAPVFCSLSTGEIALYGIASSPKGCSPINTSFNVYPILL